MNIGDQLELARHLGVTDRRVRQLEAEKVIERLDDGGYDLDESRRRYRLYASGDMDAVCRQIEDGSKCVDEMFSRMRAEDDVEKRRQIVAEDGRAIGRLQVAMDIANAMGPEPAREMLRTFTKMSMGRVMSECLSLCNWRHVADAEVKV